MDVKIREIQEKDRQIVPLYRQDLKLLLFPLVDRKSSEFLFERGGPKKEN